MKLLKSCSALGVAWGICLGLPWLNPFAPGPSPNVVPWLISLACISVLFGVLSFVHRQWHQDVARFCAGAWLAAGLLSCVFGLLQYLGIASTFAPWINPTSFGEAFANLRQRNQFATLTSISVAALLLLVTINKRVQLYSGAKHFSLYLPTVILIAVGNGISSSRTGLLQILLLGGLYTLWGGLQRKDVRQVLLVGLLAYIVAMFAVPWLAGLDPDTHGAFARFGNDAPCASRITLWSNVIHLIAQKPWLGWGWGELDYAHFITLYDERRFCDILDNAHNLPLHLAVELGIPFSMLVCGSFAWWVLRQKPWAETDAARQMAWAVVAVILLHSMLEYPLWYGPFQMAFVLCVVILWPSSKILVQRKNSLNQGTNTAKSQLKRAQPAIFLIASLLGLALATYAAWDYHRVSQIYLQPQARDPAYADETLAKVKKSWLFPDQALFAELLITPLTTANARWVYITAVDLLHYSPEPRVVQKVVESAVMLGKDAEAIGYLARFKAAFPAEHAAWAVANGLPPPR